MELVQCPLCDAKPLRWTTSPYVVKSRGQTRTIPNVRRQKCISCGEEFFDEVANRVLDRYRGKRKRSVIAVG